MSSVRIISISDLHFRKDWHEEVGLVFGKFLDEIEKVPKDEHRNILLFSGDLVNAGGDPDQYGRLFDDLDRTLTKAGISRSDRLIIPGNHDVSQETLKDSLLTHFGALSQVEDETTFNNGVKKELLPILAPKFKNFLSFQDKFVSEELQMKQIWGQGVELNPEIGVYLLNTALCSHGGVKDKNGNTISDKGRLMVNTRDIHDWLARTDFQCRILVMHHPLDWLCEWSCVEVEDIINSSFQVVYSGHVHKQKTSFVRVGEENALYCSSPPLFTRKTEVLGYASYELIPNDHLIKVTYRQWRKPSGFVAGTLMAGNDSGVLGFVLDNLTPLAIEGGSAEDVSDRECKVLELLTADFENAATCYSRYKGVWVDRQFSDHPENSPKGTQATLISLDQILDLESDLLIRAPIEFGLTCVGRRLAQKYFERYQGRLLLYLDISLFQPHKEAVENAINESLRRLGASKSDLDGVIVDGFQVDKRSKRYVKSLGEIDPDFRIILLNSQDGLSDFGAIGDSDALEGMSIFYLWALPRQAVRQIIGFYSQSDSSIDDDLMANKVMADIDSLNIPRTPINCLTLLRINEQQFDQSPVNRTEMIRKVLTLFFYEFDQIPRYASRPDLIDCEYALGYFCEYLIRRKATSFSKNEFFSKISEYSQKQILNIEVDVLFILLADQGIVTKHGDAFEFRFSYWLYFFAAHRMHHDTEFSKYILEGRRYATYPLLLEFYSGIDRRRSDAVEILVKDLEEMNGDFRSRSGIQESVDPYSSAKWEPNIEALQAMEEEVNEGLATTNLPSEVKDQISDRTYDRSKPYHQEVAHFIEVSSLIEYSSAAEGAARVLRNSDHVAPELRQALLAQIVICWVSVVQTLVVLSKILAVRGEAMFEGMGFYLDDSIRGQTEDERWQTVMRVIPANVTGWFHEGLFSKKLGPLLFSYMKDSSSPLGVHLIRRVVVYQKPPGWEKELERFVIGEQKNSFYLLDVYSSLRREIALGFIGERTTRELKRLAGMSIAKHVTGKSRPDAKLIERAVKEVIDQDRK